MNKKMSTTVLSVYLHNLYSYNSLGFAHAPKTKRVPVFLKTGTLFKYFLRYTSFPLGEGRDGATAL